MLRFKGKNKLYNSIEKSLKLIYALLKLRDIKNENPYDYLFNALKDNSHGIDKIYKAITDIQKINLLVGIEISYDPKKDIGGYFSVRFNNIEFILNDSFSTRYPYYSSNIGLNIPVTDCNYGPKLKFGYYLYNIAKALLGRVYNNEVGKCQ